MLRVLGPLEVDGPDGAVSVGGPIPRRILTALILHAGSACSGESLIAAAWGDSPPASAERTLVSHLTRLRDALARAGGPAAADAPWIEHDAGGYRLKVALDAVDAVCFQRAVDAASGLSPGRAVPALRKALELWRSAVPYADLQGTAYPSGDAARLVESRSSATESLAAALIDDGDPAPAVALVRERLAEDAFRERLWELLILALYRHGRQGDALAAYQEARSVLREGLGVDPGPGLRELEARVLAQDPRLLAATSQIRHPCPYKGLARYDSGDAVLFVGRERLVEELVGRLVDHSLVAVVGASGAGKSSLVRAGLVPALSQGGLLGSGTWSVRVVVPGSAPLEVVNGALDGSPDLLVVDQAEEALLADNGGCVVPFGDRVLAAIAGGTRVVLVLRADFYGLLAGHAELARRAGPATVLVGAPGEVDLRRILTEPAFRVGLRVEPALVDLVLAEVRDRPGVLPILSTALVRTWENRDGDLMSVASYRTGGGVAAALESVGEEAWAALDDDAARSACRRMLLRLAVSENGSWVRRWVRRAELAGLEDQAARAALAVLTDRRLVVARADDVSVAHEALLTGWPRLHGWLEDGQARAQTRERLAAAAATWQDDGLDPAALYRGTRLQAALDTAAASPQDLTPLERTFLRESADSAERELEEQRTRAEREARGRRRTRTVAAGLAIALAFAGSAGAYAVVQQRQAVSSEALAVRSAVVADASRLGALARSTGDYDRALLLAAQAVKLNPSPGTRSDLFATLLRGDAVVVTMRAGPVNSAAFSPDGASIVGVTNRGQVLRWRAQGGPLTQITRFPGPVEQIATSPGLLVVRIVDAHLRVLDADTGRTLGPEVIVSAKVPMTLTADRRVALFVTPDDSHVAIWRLGTPASTTKRVPIQDTVTSLVACGADTACALTAHHQLVRVTLSTRVVGQRVALSPEFGTSLVASPDGRRLAMAGGDGILRLLDAQSGRVVRTYSGASRDLRALAFSPNGRQVAAADYSTVLVWRTDVTGLPERYDVQGGRAVSAEWSPDGATLATLGADGGVVTLDMTGRHRLGAVITDALNGDAATVWPMRQSIVVGQFDGGLLFVDPVSGGIHAAYGYPPGAEVGSARSGRSGDLLVTADSTGRTEVWDIPSRSLLGPVPLPRADPPGTGELWVSPDGTKAATLHGTDGPIIFDPRTRRVIRRLPGPYLHSDAWSAVVQGWTADGSALLISQQLNIDKNELLVVDATTGQIRLRIETGPANPREATEDSAGRFIAIVTSEGTLLVRDAKDGHPLAPSLPANDGDAYNVSVSPDGRYISTSGRPPRLSIWDTTTFRQVGIPLPVDVNAPEARARFAPDGRLIVATGKVLRAFTIDAAAWLARACREAGRQLNRSEFNEVLPGKPYDPACAQPTVRSE
jgi:DNA-binding SARP family transcriptional activator/WD40 repeat protein